MITACRESGTKEPDIRYDHAGLWVEFSYKTAVETPVETTVEAPVKTTVKTPVKILECLSGHPHATLAETAEAIGKSLRAVERASSKLVKDGRLRFVGPQKGSRWEVIQ
ncbi:MAG TPA: winged helix-turn-helix transcriptional regulator [Spirochaetota bacterium]|nr:winged helix-turn-helix transcriptional regulator [Spirochaetota bacterium]